MCGIIINVSVISHIAFTRYTMILFMQQILIRPLCNLEHDKLDYNFPLSVLKKCLA